MVFWIAILAGALFTWFAVKLGFYDTLAILFNIVIAIYTAVFLTPVIVNFIPAAADIPGGKALTLTALAVGIFFILFGISYTFITGQFNISFPKICDVLFAPLLGFLTGFLVLSFAAFVISVTPISQNKLAIDMGLNRHSQQANISYLCWWCDLVHRVVSYEDGPKSTEQAIDWYVQNAAKKTREELVEPNEPNRPDFPPLARSRSADVVQTSKPPDTNVPAPTPAHTSRRARGFDGLGSSRDE
jgi:hypothetical protein